MEVQVVFSQQLRRFSRWLRNDIALASGTCCARSMPHAALSASRFDEREPLARKRSRHITVETMEPRLAMTADPIWVGGVYVEEDVGSDQHGDAFHITFKGGAAGTQLSRLIIDGDLNTPGFSLAICSLTRSIADWAPIIRMVSKSSSWKRPMPMQP